jgi:tripartite-type tricarboxylate transporter receptor subunit TctC
LFDVMGGQVAGFIGDVPGLISHVRGGRLRAIGVAAPTRHPALPDVRTFEEQGLKGIDTNNWYALFVSSKTSPDAVESLNKAVRAALTNPDVKAKLSAMGAEPASRSRAARCLYLKAEPQPIEA